MISGGTYAHSFFIAKKKNKKKNLLEVGPYSGACLEFGDDVIINLVGELTRLQFKGPEDIK